MWIDTKKSERMERADLFTQGIRKGDVIILLSRSDLGRGREIERFEALAEKLGATIQVVAPEKEPEKPKPGPVPYFQPTEQQRARIAHYWHGPFKRSEALRIASEIMGREITASVLNKALGPRSKPKREGQK